MMYSIDITHTDDGEITPIFRDVASDAESLRRIAVALRIIADRLDGDGWRPERVRPERLQ